MVTFDGDDISDIRWEGDSVVEIRWEGETVWEPLSMIEDFEDDWWNNWTGDMDSFDTTSNPLHPDSTLSLTQTSGYDAIGEEDYSMDHGHEFTVLVQNSDSSADLNTMFGVQDPSDAWGGDHYRIRMRYSMGTNGRVDILEDPGDDNQSFGVTDAGVTYEIIWYYGSDVKRYRLRNYEDDHIVTAGSLFDSQHSGGSVGVRGTDPDDPNYWDRFVDRGEYSFDIPEYTVVEDFSWGGTDSVSDHYDGHTNAYTTTSSNTIQGDYSLERPGDGWHSIAHSSEAFSRGDRFGCRVRCPNGGNGSFLFGVQDSNNPFDDCYSYGFGDRNARLRKYSNGSYTESASSWNLPNSTDEYRIYVEYDVSDNGVIYCETLDAQNRPLSGVSIRDTEYQSGPFGWRAQDSAEDMLADYVVEYDEPMINR